MVADNIVPGSDSEEAERSYVAVNGNGIGVICRCPHDLCTNLFFMSFATDLRSRRIARGPGRPGKGGEEDERGWTESNHGST